MKEPTPPQWPQRLLQWYCNPELLEEIQGDLHEAFLDRVERRGRWLANLFYVLGVLKFVRPYAGESRNTPVYPASRWELFKNYGRLSVRYLLKHRGSFAINVLGLAMGLATCLAIVHYVRFEQGYDAFHQHADRIYRVSMRFQSAEGEELVAPIAYGVAPALQEDLPEVEAATRLVPTTAVIKNAEGELFNENYFYRADPEIFRVFTYPLLAGDPTQALEAPHSVVLSQTTAQKYFGGADPSSLIGQPLRVNHTEHTITGILQDVPSNTDLPFDALLSLEFNPDEWLEIDSYTYVLLREGTDAVALEQKLADFDDRRVNPMIKQLWGTEDYQIHHRLYPLTELHYTTLMGDTEHKGDRTYVYIFSLIALALLLVAGMNYVNLFIAQAGGRNIEVGVCKAMGARQFQLWRQFMGECFITTLLALLLAVGLLLVLGPYTTALLGEPITLASLTRSGMGYALVGGLVVVSLLAGSYPAFALSSFHPVAALRGGSLVRRGRGRLRKLLIVLQFTAAIGMVAGTLAVRDQVTYLRHMDLGFQQEQMLSIGLQNNADPQRVAQLKHTLLQDTRIRRATTGSRPDALWALLYASVTQQGQSRTLSAKGIPIDEDYLDVLNISLVAGRNFAPADTQYLLVNEAFVREAGWNEPLGQEVALSDTDRRTVVGVVKDFHFAPLHQKIEPLVLTYEPHTLLNLLVSVAPTQVETLRSYWSRFFPEVPFEFEFLDDAFDRKYQTELRMLTLFRYFTGLSLFIACLGLLGLTSFTVQQKTKEIGVRKVLGAGKSAILRLLSHEFGLLLALSALLATPLAYLGVRYWLQNFAYQTTVGLSVYLLSVAGVAGIALLTLSYHTLKAAATNPVDALRHE